jgi:hypothetical protein
MRNALSVILNPTLTMIYIFLSTTTTMTTIIARVQKCVQNALNSSCYPHVLLKVVRVASQLVINYGFIIYYYYYFNFMP